MTNNEGFTHFDEDGRPQMVDVSDKPETERVAVAQARIQMLADTRRKIESGTVHKGDVIAVAELAGIMAAKKTSDLIPLCHHIPITKVNIECRWDDTENTVRSVLIVEATVKTTYRTGVEMEALTACSVAALTVYDMCKAVDRDMAVQEVKLLAKSGGRSGTYTRT